MVASPAPDPGPVRLLCSAHLLCTSCTIMDGQEDRGRVCRGYCRHRSEPARDNKIMAHSSRCFHILILTLCIANKKHRSASTAGGGVQVGARLPDAPLGDLCLSLHLSLCVAICMLCMCCAAPLLPCSSRAHRCHGRLLLPQASAGRVSAQQAGRRAPLSPHHHLPPSFTICEHKT